MKGITALLRVTHPDRDGWLRLAGRRIYILPTAYGLVFGMLLMLLLIASLNYANNPAFLLTFLLTGIFFQGIFYTWRNLKGVELRWLGAEPVFAGQTARLHFQLRCPDHDRHALVLSLDGNHPVVTDCRAGSTVTLTLPYPVQRRGRHQPTRLLLESRYPLGLLRAWARLEPQGEFLVWPRPLPHDPPAAEGGAPAIWTAPRPAAAATSTALATTTRATTPARSSGRPWRPRRACWSNSSPAAGKRAAGSISTPSTTPTPNTAWRAWPAPLNGSTPRRRPTACACRAR